MFSFEDSLVCAATIEVLPILMDVTKGDLQSRAHSFGKRTCFVSSSQIFFFPSFPFFPSPIAHAKVLMVTAMNSSTSQICSSIVAVVERKKKKKKCHNNKDKLTREKREKRKCQKFVYTLPTEVGLTGSCTRTLYLYGSGITS